MGKTAEKRHRKVTIETLTDEQGNEIVRQYVDFKRPITELSWRLHICSDVISRHLKRIGKFRTHRESMSKEYWKRLSEANFRSFQSSQKSESE